jgi:hypothetical protein
VSECSGRRNDVAALYDIFNYSEPEKKLNSQQGKYPN